jgi:predicted nucleic-acid-binding Zn-ribbon protein
MNNYETCAKCGYDHEYEIEKAHYIHTHCRICKQYLDDIENCPDHECEES